jgi:hypothetical protein
MKANIHTQSEMPVALIPVVSQLALAHASIAETNDAVTETQIQELAYKLYEERGRIDGYALQDWLEAESILRERGEPAA